MTKLKVAAAIIAIFCLTATAMADPILFSNPYDVNSTNSYSSFDFGTGLNQSFADYDYDGSFAITDFHWWGMDFDNVHGTLAGFQFGIYADDGAGFPGSQVYSETVAGTAGETDTGDDLDGFVDLSVYKYGFDLANPFTGSAGKYWFSVVASSQNNWFWGLSSGRQFLNDQQYQNGVIIPGNPQEADFAFEISGRDVVPEPATLTLFGLGLLGAGFARRRKQNK